MSFAGESLAANVTLSILVVVYVSLAGDILAAHVTLMIAVARYVKAVLCHSTVCGNTVSYRGGAGGHCACYGTCRYRAGFYRGTGSGRGTGGRGKACRSDF